MGVWISVRSSCSGSGYCSDYLFGEGAAKRSDETVGTGVDISDWDIDVSGVVLGSNPYARPAAGACAIEAASSGSSGKEFRFN